MTGSIHNQPTAAASEDPEVAKSLEVADHIEDGDLKHGPQSKMNIYGQVDHIAYSAEEEQAVKRKIDRILLPLMCGCYIFSVSVARTSSARSVL